VAGAAAYIEEVRQKMILWGQVPDPFACWLLERGLKTLYVRVQRQNESAQRVAEWCATRPEIRAVHYAGLPSHPDHAIAARTMDGFGGMLAIELAGGDAATRRFMPALRMFINAASLGGCDSLMASSPGYSSHSRMSDEQRRARRDTATGWCGSASGWRTRTT
jgi:cystathionine beta-lyase/cystathionine gamma-synthase